MKRYLICSGCGTVLMHMPIDSTRIAKSKCPQCECKYIALNSRFVEVTTQQYLHARVQQVSKLMKASDEDSYTKLARRQKMGNATIKDVFIDIPEITMCDENMCTFECTDQTDGSNTHFECNQCGMRKVRCS